MDTKGKRGLRPGLPVDAESAPTLPVEATMAEEMPVAPGIAPPVVPARLPSPEKPAAFGGDAWAALIESQSAVARGLEAMSSEMAQLARTGIDAAARTATQMLAVKTLSDAFEVNAGFVRGSFDALIGGSAKLSEIGVKLAADASRPIVAQLSTDWVKATRTG
jgi:phasin family protein